MRSIFASLIHKPAYEEHAKHLEKVFADPLFDRPTGIDDPARCALTYRRLKHINDNLGLSAPLLEDRERLFTLVEWAALADPSLFYGVFLHYCTTMGAIQDFGRGRDDLDDLIGAMVSMDTIGSLMMTEVGRGNSNANIRTQAVYDAERQEFVLRTPDAAAVKFPPGVSSPFPRTAVVSARLMAGGHDRGLFFFVVPIRDADGRPCDGVRIAPQRPTAILPLDCALVSFDDVRVPFRHWLRDGAALTADGEFTDPAGDALTRTRRLLSVIRHAWEAAVVGLSAVSRASAAVAVRHAHHRRTSGRHAADVPVITYRNQQRPLFGALAAAYVTGIVAATVAGPEQPVAGARTIRTTSLLKVTVDRLAERVTVRSRQAAGALGFFADNRYLDYQGLAHSFNTAAADNQMMLLDGALTLAAGVEYEPPAHAAPTRAERDAFTPGVWTALAATRERLLHQELTTALRTATEAGRSTLDMWNENNALAEALSEAHAFSLVLDTVCTALESVADPAAKAALTDLLALYAAEEIAAHDGWYLAHGLLDADEVRSFPHRVNELCERIAPNALELAEGLDVPYEVVGAPIAEADYVHALTAHTAVAYPDPQA
ncbi:acyl-CoA dehydrogenase [Streptomyces polychromogenes]|uniref:Acyl-CoA dehydrogenase n=1 Tax=Streptomyces polychromogenes TaxID=67342 RepID=A0ABN0VRY2_9ACTN